MFASLTCPLDSPLDTRELASHCPVEQLIPLLSCTFLLFLSDYPEYWKTNHVIHTWNTSMTAKLVSNHISWFQKISLPSPLIESEIPKRIEGKQGYCLLCRSFVLTMFWCCLWPITEQTHCNMESFAKRITQTWMLFKTFSGTSGPFMSMFCSLLVLVMPDDPVEIDRATGFFMKTTKELVNFNNYYYDMVQNICNNKISKPHQNVQTYF